MIRLGMMVLVWGILSCNNKKTSTQQDESQGEFDFSLFAERFKEAEVPYQLTDTGLLKHTDTSTIRNPNFIAFIPDSVKARLAGSGKNPVYVPLVKFSGKQEHYFVLKTLAGNRTAALLVVFDKKNAFRTAFPLLIPDTDPKTNQHSSIDKSFAVSRVTSRRNADDELSEGREVYSYSAETKNFSLIMTDLMGDNQELINPIDTFARTHRFSGDYAADKRNIVSIRDGKTSNEVQFFIHFERMNGECNGELKGSAFFTSSKTAVFRQSGDPCVLELHFTSNSVRLREVEGCGSYRGIQCVIEGNFKKKKQAKGEINASVNK